MTRALPATAGSSTTAGTLLLVAWTGIGISACRPAAEPQATSSSPAAHSQDAPGAAPVMLFRGGYGYVFSDKGDQLAVVALSHGHGRHGLIVEVPIGALAGDSTALCKTEKGNAHCDFADRLVTVWLDGQDLSNSGMLANPAANISIDRTPTPQPCKAELTGTEVSWGNVPNLTVLAKTPVKGISWSSLGPAVSAQMSLRQGTITPLDGGYCWAVQPYDDPAEQREIATAVRWTGPTAGKRLSFKAVHRNDPTNVAQVDVTLRAGLVLSVQDTTRQPVTVDRGKAHPHMEMFTTLLSSPSPDTKLTCTDGTSNFHQTGVRDCIAFTTPFESCPPLRFTMPGVQG